MLKPESEMLLTSLTDHAKFDVDILKHLTTMSTGAIVLLATFLDKLAPAKNGRLAIPIAVACFLLCIMYSVKLMIVAWIGHSQVVQPRSLLVQPDSDKRSQELQQVNTSTEKLAVPSKVAFLIVQYSFMVGVGSVGFFVIRNLKRMKTRRESLAS